MATEESKARRHRYVLVLIPSLSFLGGAGMVTSGIKDVVRVIDATKAAVVEVNAALKTPQPVTCKSEFRVKPVKVE